MKIRNLLGEIADVERCVCSCSECERVVTHATRRSECERAVTLRCSLENFGEFDYVDDKAEGAVRHVRIFPLYAINVFHKLSER